MRFAIDAIRDQGTIVIRLDEESDSAVLVVSDDGGGMSSEELERCLEPFFTTKTKGSGLGLSECHGVVRQHGGVMDIVSAQGSGTKVRVLLPLAETASGIDVSACDLRPRVARNEWHRRAQ